MSARSHADAPVSAGLTGSIRTFIAVELPAEAREALEGVQEVLCQSPASRAGRWVACESIHLTLKFLGEVPASRLPSIHEATARGCAGRAPLAIRLSGLGCFPNARRPRVVWVGVEEPTGGLVALQRAVEDQLSKLGFSREGRAFSPHLTVARIHRGATGREIEVLGRLVAQTQIGVVAEFQADGVSVMRSELRPSGAVYTQLSFAPLVAP